MGDIVEITTGPSDLGVYYKVSARALTFSIKGYGGCIGLAESPDTTGLYMVFFARNGQVHVHSNTEHKNSRERIFTLSDTEYKKFWMAWEDGFLQLCSGDAANCIFSMPLTDNPKLDYIIFFTLGDPVGSVSWKIELPPLAMIELAKTIPSKDVTGGDLRWVQAQKDGSIPPDAVIGGYEGEVLYVIRGHHSGSLTPGKFVPSTKLAFVPWGGQATQVNKYEFLCGHNYAWVPASEDKVPSSAFVAGHSEVHHEKLFIGRAVYKDWAIPGKVQPTHRVCYFPYDGKETNSREYEVLTVPGTNGHAAGDKYFPTRENFPRLDDHFPPIGVRLPRHVARDLMGPRLQRFIEARARANQEEVMSDTDEEEE